MQAQIKETQVKEPSSSLTEDIRRMADEIRVKIHLAAMDAKDVWYKLEPKLHAFEHKAEVAKDKLTDGIDRVGEELKDQLSKLLDRLRSN